MRLETRLIQGDVDPEKLPRDLDSERTMLLVFGGADARSRLAKLREAFPRSRMLGCSTAGEIFQDRIVDDALSVAVARFDDTDLALASATTGPGEASFAAGREVAEALLRPGLRAVFVLSEGLGVNGSELVRGMAAVLPEDVRITGGLAGDGERFRSTWVTDGTPRASPRVVALGFRGERVKVGHGSEGGWDKFGLERRVTRSEGNVLYELDGKPALALYKQYLGERASGLPATALLFPLSMRAAADKERQLVRTILAVSEEAQSLTFAGDVPEGSVVQLMHANFDRLVQGASEAGAHAGVGAKPAGDTLAVAISCVGRRLVLGERTEEEIEATLEALPPKTRQIGFYSYGEISPLLAGACELHNQTMTVTAISEG